MLAALINLFWTASDYFTQANNIWMGELDDLFKLLSCEIEVDDSLEHWRL